MVYLLPLIPVPRLVTTMVLKNEPLPICIPSGAGCPKEWYLNDGHDHTPIQKDLINKDRRDMDKTLCFFTRIARFTIEGIIRDLPPAPGEPEDSYNNSFSVLCCGQKLRKCDIMYHVGSGPDPDLQEGVLGLLADGAERNGFTLGEIKVLIWVSQISSRPMLGFGVYPDEQKKEIQHCKHLLESYRFTDAKKYDWGGGLGQIKPILTKAVDWVEKRLIKTFEEEGLQYIDESTV